jgi:hypothetical protein
LVPGIDGFTGEIYVGGGNAGGVIQFELCALNSSGNWDEADADLSSTKNLLGVALNSTVDVLLRGMIKYKGFSFTVGAPIYVSRTPGLFTQTLTGFTTGDYVRLVGHAVAADTLYFNPEPTWILQS